MSVQCPGSKTTPCSASVAITNPYSSLVPDPAANVCLLNTQRLGFGQVSSPWLSLYAQSQAVSALDSAGVQSTTYQKSNPALSTVAATRILSSAAGQAAVSTHGFTNAQGVLGGTVMSVTNQNFGTMSGGLPVGQGFTATLGDATPRVPTYGGILSSPLSEGTPAGSSFLG